MSVIIHKVLAVKVFCGHNLTDLYRHAPLQVSTRCTGCADMCLCRCQPDALVILTRVSADTCLCRPVCLPALAVLTCVSAGVDPACRGSLVVLSRVCRYNRWYQPTRAGRHRAFTGPSVPHKEFRRPEQDCTANHQHSVSQG